MKDVSDEILTDLILNTVDKMQDAFRMGVGQHVNGRQSIEVIIRISCAMLASSVAQAITNSSLDESDIGELRSVLLKAVDSAILKGIETGLELREMVGAHNDVA